MSKNNIIVNNIINIENKSILLENELFDTINATGICEINLLNCNIMKLNIKVNNDSNLTINWFNIITNNNVVVNIECANKSSLTINHSYLNKDNYNLNIISKFLNEESNISVNIHGINNKGTSKIIVDGYIDSDKINNVLNENIRFININGGKVVSNPNIYVGTSKVIANHNNTIKNIDSNELLYLMSKGLDEKQSSKLICNGFLVKIIKNKDLKTRIKEIINRR